jgi:glucokinase
MIEKSMEKLLLAGDIGGTKTLLGVFEHAAVRPKRIAVRGFGTLDHAQLSDIIEEFLRGAGVAADQLAAACFGVAGPVIDEAAALTNVPWRVEASRVRQSFGIKRVALLNDLQAMAYGVPVLADDEVHVLQKGEPVAAGNIAIIAAGTGLGEALLHHMD